MAKKWYKIIRKKHRKVGLTRKGHFDKFTTSNLDTEFKAVLILDGCLLQELNKTI